MSSIPPNPPKLMLLALLSCILVYSLLKVDMSPYSPRMTSIATDLNSQSRSLGREIVERAYDQTYKRMVESCPEDWPLLWCMKSMHTNQTTEFPWWFETLLRDGGNRDYGLHGPWHYNLLKTPTHDVQFCNIEKTASSEWKILQCRLKNQTGMCQGGKGKAEDPKAVFLRDPLERFLSGFVDKCINKGKRDKEAHCEPNVIYAPGTHEERLKRFRDKGAPSPPMVIELETSKKVFFDAYVDTLPLKWNLHFFPSSLYCNGLFRTLPNYDFVGTMGEEFHDNLREFGSRYKMLEKVQEVFNLVPVNKTQSKNSTDQESRLRKKRFALERTGSSSKRIKEYYTPRTLRRALEYLSIDYSTKGLNLPIPQWVDEMLQQEVEEGISPRAVAFLP